MQIRSFRRSFTRKIRNDNFCVGDSIHNGTPTILITIQTCVSLSLGIHRTQPNRSAGGEFEKSHLGYSSKIFAVCTRHSRDQLRKQIFASAKAKSISRIVSDKSNGLPVSLPRLSSRVYRVYTVFVM